MSKRCPSFNLSRCLIGQNTQKHLHGWAELLRTPQWIETLLNSRILVQSQWIWHLEKLQTLTTYHCVSVCVRVRSRTTRGFFEQAAQPLRLQEQETRHKDRLSSGRVWPEHRTTRVLSQMEREKERRRRDAGSWRFCFAAHCYLGKEKGEEKEVKDLREWEQRKHGVLLKHVYFLYLQLEKVKI